MPAGVIGKRLNIGYEGTYARTPDAIIMTRLVQAGADTIDFGQAVALNDDNTYSPINDATNADKFAGVCVREVKQSVDFYSQASGYVAGEFCPCIMRGSMTIRCQAGTPVAGGKVYLRIGGVTPPGSKLGGYEAASAAVPGALKELTNLRWTTGELDPNRIAEVAIIERIQP